MSSLLFATSFSRPNEMIFIFKKCVITSFFGYVTVWSTKRESELSSTRGQNSRLPKSLNSRLPKNTELSSTDDRTLVYHYFIFLKAIA